MATARYLARLSFGDAQQSEIKWSGAGEGLIQLVGDLESRLGRLNSASIAVDTVDEPGDMRPATVLAALTEKRPDLCLHWNQIPRKTIPPQILELMRQLGSDAEITIMRCPVHSTDSTPESSQSSPGPSV